MPFMVPQGSPSPEALLALGWHRAGSHGPASLDGRWLCSPLGHGGSASLGFYPDAVVCAALVSPAVGLLHQQRSLKLSRP